MMAVQEIRREDTLYPPQLLQLHDPPETLYCLGDTALLTGCMAAVVGSRKCSTYGRQVAMKIAGSLADAGITVVSGMAKGIDSFAHLGALNRGGKTIAVLGCGPDVCYPAANREIYARIAEEGLLLSEYAPGAMPQRYCFPRRNRIIAGLSAVVTVVEAGPNSGALITAEHAATLSREVFSVPGNITSACSLGTNKLIAEGANPLVVIADLVRALGGQPAESAEELEKLGKTERAVMQILQNGGETTMDELCRKLGKTPVEMSSLVTILEIKGYLVSSMGKIFLANP